jgi:hypothetical protein
MGPAKLKETREKRAAERSGQVMTPNAPVEARKTERPPASLHRGQVDTH